eukprot:816129-Alexandrium_andersonii.AAC.1
MGCGATLADDDLGPRGGGPGGAPELPNTGLSARGCGGGLRLLELLGAFGWGAAVHEGWQAGPIGPRAHGL